MLGQLISPSVLVTVPLPLVDTVNRALELNVAVTDKFWIIVILHGPVPVQAPLQPVNAHPWFGLAFNVTCVLAGYK